MIHIDLVRADTPSAATQAFLNSAGASLMPHPVLQVQRDYLAAEAALGGYAAADRHARQLDAVYGSVSRLINAAPGEIALMESATAAWKMDFYSLDLRIGDVVLSCEAGVCRELCRAAAGGAQARHSDPGSAVRPRQWGNRCVDFAGHDEQTGQVDLPGLGAYHWRAGQPRPG